MSKINNGIVVINNLEDYLELRDIFVDLVKQHFEILNMDTSDELFMLANATSIMILLSGTPEGKKHNMEKFDLPRHEGDKLALQLAEHYTIIYDVTVKEWNKIQDIIADISIRTDNDINGLNGGLIN